MVGLATMLGVSQFVFVQWMAPFLSELPEFTSTTYWARSRGKAGMALMNMASSNINQWTVLAAMIPIVYSWSLGTPTAAPHGANGTEVPIALLQGGPGLVQLGEFKYPAHETFVLPLFWALDFA